MNTARNRSVDMGGDDIPPSTPSRARTSSRSAAKRVAVTTVIYNLSAEVQELPLSVLSQNRLNLVWIASLWYASVLLDMNNVDGKIISPSSLCCAPISSDMMIRC